LLVSGGWLSLVPSIVLLVAFYVSIDPYLNRLKAALTLLLLATPAIGMLMVTRGNSVIGFGSPVGTFVLGVEGVGRLVFSRRPAVPAALGLQQ
jgi:hypothetical protein